MKASDAFSGYSLALYNYKLFQSFQTIAENPASEGSADILCLQELFGYIDNNWSELHVSSNLTNLLPILHYTVQLESRSSSSRSQVCEFVRMLLDKHKGHDSELQLVLKVYYQLLKSSSECNYSDLPDAVDTIFPALCDALFDCGQLLASNILTCIQLQIRACKRYDLLHVLWQRVADSKSNENLRLRLAQILAHIIDDLLEKIESFYKDAQLLELMQLFLASDVREERRTAVYLLEKVTPLMVESAKKAINSEILSESLRNSWSSYLAIFTSLEERQSHLILQTLTNIKDILLDQVWFDLLYTQLLKHRNILILRWTFDHILENVTCIQLSPVVTKHFLEAANQTEFYNYEDYCISENKIKKFLSCDVKEFVNIMSEINWKSVPLCFWLKNMEAMHYERIDITKATLLQIASRVRMLQNPIIRLEAISYFERLFKAQIETLNIADYFRLIENLYNASDSFSCSSLTLRRLNVNDEVLNDISFNQRLYDIFEYNSSCDYNIFRDIDDNLISIFKRVPRNNHGWFRFLAVFDFNDNPKKLEFCRNMYDLDLDNIPNLNTFVETAVAKLVWNSAEESFVRMKAVDYYVTTRIVLFDGLRVMSLSPAHLLSEGGRGTLLWLTILIRNSGVNVNFQLLDILIKELETYTENSEFCFLVLMHLVEIIKKLFYKDLLERYTKILVTQHKLHLGTILNGINCKSIGRDLFNELYLEDIFSGDARIEKRYELESFNRTLISPYKRSILINIILKSGADCSRSFFEFLLQKNNEIDRKNPIYLQNSYEHCVKIRIGISISIILKSKKYWSDKFWKIIFQENNPINITYFYERIIAYCAPNIDIILKYLKEISQYTSCQQVSIIIITCTYCMLNWHQAENSESTIINLLLPLTMGANFQIRLYAQLAIYKIIEKITYKDSLHLCLMEAVTLANGDKMDELLNDIRLNIDHDNILNFDEVLFATNAPFFEIPSFKDLLSKSKEINISKTKENVLQPEKIVDERRLSIFSNGNLISYPECRSKQEKDGNIIVVASLIDKLPNLEGIARSCEFFGVSNLVVKSKKHMLCEEMKNLSINITEAKPDSLSEFLKQKQEEGFEVVGAEQTANSKSFVNFEFPKKCILLLGHEKEGIPANLLFLLNHTVQIPQFGLVRSLNVHVTGALFMWEFRKQHLP